MEGFPRDVTMLVDGIPSSIGWIAAQYEPGSVFSFIHEDGILAVQCSAQHIMRTPYAELVTQVNDEFAKLQAGRRQC